MNYIEGRSATREDDDAMDSPNLREYQYLSILLGILVKEPQQTCDFTGLKITANILKEFLSGLKFVG